MKIKKLATMASASALLVLMPAQPAAADDTVAAVLGFGAGLITNNSTTLGNNAGELESWSVAAQIADAAADKLWGQLNQNAPAGRGVMLLGTSQAFDLSAYAMVKARTRWLDRRLGMATCPPPPGAKADAGTTVTSLPTILTAVQGVLKSETKIDDKIITPPEAFWLNAVAGSAKGRTIVTPTALLPKPDAAVANDWLALVDRAARTPCAQSKDPAAKPMQDLIAEITTTDAGFRKADAGKMSLLEQASALEGLGLGSTPLLVLRTSQQKVGGTIIQTKNIFTALGAPALRIGGGMVITWELSEIDAGGTGAKVITAGNLACTAPMRQLGTVNSTPMSKAVRAASCRISDPDA